MKNKSDDIGRPTSLRLQPNLYQRAVDIAARDRTNSRIVIEQCMEMALPVLESGNQVAVVALMAKINADPMLVHKILKGLK